MFCKHIIKFSALRGLFLSAVFLVLCTMVLFPHNVPLAAQIGIVGKEGFDKEWTAVRQVEVVPGAGRNYLESGFSQEKVLYKQDPVELDDFNNIDDIQKKLKNLDGNIGKILSLMDRMYQSWLYKGGTSSHTDEDLNPSKIEAISRNRSMSTPWDYEQLRRRAKILKYCPKSQEKHKTLAQLIKDKELSANLLLDEEHKLIYCYIPKVACTEWKRLLMILSHKTTLKETQLIPHGMAHFGNHLTLLKSLPPDDIEKRVKEYKKFIFVREPHERLLSAYLDKFVKNNSDAKAFKKYYAKTMMDKVRKNGTVPETGDGMKFSEFLTFLSIKDNPGSLQEHWKPYYNLCHPCSINYDVIGKYETLNEDSNHILKSVKSELKFPPFQPTKTKELLKSYLAQVDKSVLEKLYHNYENDFLLFGYNKEPYS